jgi:hypothetical protein
MRELRIIYTYIYYSFLRLKVYALDYSYFLITSAPPPHHYLG